MRIFLCFLNSRLHSGSETSLLLRNPPTKRSANLPTYQNRYVAQLTGQHTLIFINLAQRIVLRTLARLTSLHFWPDLDQQACQLTLLPGIGFSFLPFWYDVRFVEDRNHQNLLLSLFGRRVCF
jgi:hypothetical protein